MCIVRSLPDISIHAPVKGATLEGVPPRQGKPPISIHAPVKGATQRRTNRLPWLRDFNPRSREGSDVPQSRFYTAIEQFQSTLP